MLLCICWLCFGCYYPFFCYCCILYVIYTVMCYLYVLNVVCVKSWSMLISRQIVHRLNELFLLISTISTLPAVIWRYVDFLISLILALHHVEFLCCAFLIVRWQRPVFWPNLAMSGNNRFSAFFSSLYHVVQESVGCTDFPLLAFSKFKMASNML